MKKLVFFLIFIFLMAPAAEATFGYFLDRMNFPPGESRTHRIDVSNPGNATIFVNVTLPSGFSAGGTNCAYPAPGGVFVCTILAGSSSYANVISPGSCVEGTTYTSNLSNSSGFLETLTYVCIPDDKIIDHKIEYGHGDANYLTENYISNETSTLFNLIRIFNIGHYLNPNEDAQNATIQCLFEDYTVRTYGRTEITHNSTNVISNFSWPYIEGGYWFRIGVVSQEFTGKPVGESYNVSCSQMTYNFTHAQVVVPNLTYNLEVRSLTPLQINFEDYPDDINKILVRLTNAEEYTLFDLFFEKILSGLSDEHHIIQLFSGQSATFLADRNNTYNFSFHFIPAWYRNSRNPQYYVQNFFFNGSMGPIISSLDQIPDITFLEDSVFTGLDLDNYVADPDTNDSLLTWNVSSASNLTILIDNSTHLVNITPDANFFGNQTVVFTVTDPSNISDNQSVLVTVLSVNDLPVISPAIPTQLRAPGSGSFILDLNSYETDVDDVDANLSWTVLGVDDWCVNISINASDSANITPLTNLACQDRVTFVLSDDENLTDQQDVEIRYNSTLSLIQGWNLISFPPLKNLSVMDVLAPLGNGYFGCGRNSSNISVCNSSNNDFNGTWNSVQTYNASSSQFLVFNPTDYYLTIPLGQEFQDFNILKGYWIEMTDNDTLELDFG